MICCARRLASELEITSAIPILGMFDEDKAREVDIDCLGFTIAFEHRLEEKAPLHMGLALDRFELHLSEHYGDATPVSAIRLEGGDLGMFHAQSSKKKYKHYRDGIQSQDWGFDEISIQDPFGNRLIFTQPYQSVEGS